MTRRSFAVPLFFDGDLAVVEAPALVRAKAAHVLGTEPQELPWRTSFGVGLDGLRHGPTDEVQAELVRIRVRDALAQWMPSVSAATTVVGGDGTLRATIVLGAAGALEVER